MEVVPTKSSYIVAIVASHVTLKGELAKAKKGISRSVKNLEKTGHHRQEAFTHQNLFGVTESLLCMEMEQAHTAGWGGICTESFRRCMR